jgi:Arc/MetJ family transcription regulator
MEALMDETIVELDEQALTAAAKFYGTTTRKDTVNAALREAAQRHRRREAFDRLAAMAVAGDFDILLDKANYRR